ncbi:unnamed protein product [Ectocarpus sp. 12 AP-2014]
MSVVRNAVRRHHGTQSSSLDLPSAVVAVFEALEAHMMRELLFQFSTPRSYSSPFSKEGEDCSVGWTSSRKCALGQRAVCVTKFAPVLILPNSLQILHHRNTYRFTESWAFKQGD